MWHKDRKEAAAAYRNLGAIAGLGDPKRALEAYEKAIALDPDDLESLFWAGSIQIDYGNLEKAQSRLERVLTLAETANHVVYKYRALVDLGSIKQRRGDLEGALKSYSNGLAIIEPLAKSEPVNAHRRYDLGIINERIGDVQLAQRDLAAALKSYEAKHDIISRLATSDPGNAGWQRDLSVALCKIGEVQKAQGDLAGALKSYNDSLAIIDRLAKSDPGNPEWQRDLSMSHRKIGDVQKAQGDLAGALKSYKVSSSIAELLAKSDPGNAGWQRDLSDCFRKLRKLASDYQKSGDSAKAFDCLRQGQTIISSLTKLSPDNAQWKQDLEVVNQDIAQLAKR